MKTLGLGEEGQILSLEDQTSREHSEYTKPAEAFGSDYGDLGGPLQSTVTCAGSPRSPGDQVAKHSGSEANSSPPFHLNDPGCHLHSLNLRLCIIEWRCSLAE